MRNCVFPFVRDQLGRSGPGGARRDRTDDLMLAKHALYQLSYGPSQSRQRELSFDPRRPGQRL